MPRRRSAAATAVLVPLLLLVGCGGDRPNGDIDAEVDVPPSQFAPTAEPSDLTPADLDGDVLELPGAGRITMPDGAVAEGPEGPLSNEGQVSYRMPDADDDGLPAVQITWGPDTVGVYEQSYASETVAGLTDGVQDYVRSAVTWPGSTEAVVATWTQELELVDGGTAVTDALRLTVQNESGVTVVVLAAAEHGELDDSDAVRALRSLVLD